MGKGSHALHFLLRVQLSPWESHSLPPKAWPLCLGALHPGNHDCHCFASVCLPHNFPSLLGFMRVYARTWSRSYQLCLILGVRSWDDLHRVPSLEALVP